MPTHGHWVQQTPLVSSLCKRIQCGTNDIQWSEKSAASGHGMNHCFLKGSESWMLSLCRPTSEVQAKAGSDTDWRTALA
jgi:hypothetical protein